MSLHLLRNNYLHSDNRKKKKKPRKESILILLKIIKRRMPNYLALMLLQNSKMQYLNKKILKGFIKAI
jgi:hypothetical protein